MAAGTHIHWCVYHFVVTHRSSHRGTARAAARPGPGPRPVHRQHPAQPWRRRRPGVAAWTGCCSTRPRITASRRRGTGPRRIARGLLRLALVKIQRRCRPPLASSTAPRAISARPAAHRRLGAGKRAPVRRNSPSRAASVASSTCRSGQQTGQVQCADQATRAPRPPPLRVDIDPLVDHRSRPRTRFTSPRLTSCPGLVPRCSASQSRLSEVQVVAVAAACRRPSSMSRKAADHRRPGRGLRGWTSRRAGPVRRPSRRSRSPPRRRVQAASRPADRQHQLQQGQPAAQHPLSTSRTATSAAIGNATASSMASLPLNQVRVRLLRSRPRSRQALTPAPARKLQQHVDDEQRRQVAVEDSPRVHDAEANRAGRRVPGRYQASAGGPTTTHDGRHAISLARRPARHAADRYGKIGR